MTDRVTYKENILQGIRSAHFLYHQTQPISQWIPFLEKINTRYVVNGSILKPTRCEEWKGLSEEGMLWGWPVMMIMMIDDDRWGGGGGCYL